MCRLISLAFASLCLVTIGCGLGSEDISVPQSDSGTPLRTDGLPAPGLQKPIVDRPPASVCTESVPIQGTAAPGASVFAMGGLETSGVSTDAHPTTGRFCLDVRLKPGAENVIEVRAQDPELGLSEPDTVTVRQGTCSTNDVPPTVEEPQPENVALGQKARASKTADSGNEGFLTDGKTSTVVTYSGGWGWTDAAVWVTVKLPKLTEVGKIVVKWGSDYAAKYKVLVSAMTDPGDPDLKNGYWTEVKSFDAGDGGTDTVDLKDSKPPAQHVALWMNQDGKGWTWGETFALAELEVWDVPKKTTAAPTVPANTCQSIGN
jgi:hypothetical protein